MKTGDKKPFGIENPFRVPDGYFENLTTRVHVKTRAAITGQRKTPGKLRWVAPWIGVAAAFVIAVLTYRHLPETILSPEPDMFGVDADFIYQMSPLFLPSDFDLMNYISSNQDFDPNIYPDSIIFRGIDEYDLMQMLTYFE